MNRNKVNRKIVHLVMGVLLALATTVSAEDVWVHFAGDLKKPGVYKVSSPATVQELEKICGGWTEFGSAKSLTVIRLERPSNATMNDPGEPQSKIYKFAEIPREGDKLILKKDDIVFIPAKGILGQ